MSHWSESIFLCVVHWWCWSVEFLIFVAMAIINQEFLVVAAVVVVFNSPDLIGVIASLLSWDCGLLSFLARLFMGNVARLTCNWRNKCFTLGNISATERRWVHILYCLALFPKRSLIARISVNLITLLYAFESRFLVCQHHVGRTFFKFYSTREVTYAVHNSILVLARRIVTTSGWEEKSCRVLFSTNKWISLGRQGSHDRGL